MHDVFHISLLKPYNHRPGDPPIDTSAPELRGDEEVWEVEKILGRRIRKGKEEYLLHWKGHLEEWNSWQLATDFDNMEELLQEFQDPKGRGTRTTRSKVAR